MGCGSSNAALTPEPEQKPQRQDSSPLKQLIQEKEEPEQNHKPTESEAEPEEELCVEEEEEEETKEEESEPT